MLQATTAVMKEGTMADHWFRGADLTPGSSVSAMWVMVVLFILILVLAPKIKTIKEGLSGALVMKFIAWLVVIVGIIAAIHYDVPRFIMSYIN